MMASAYADGADYMYRVNDDTKFDGPWVVDAIRTLQTYSPPDLGVVGPICAEGNSLILTHDFTHRTHLQVFEYYYPPVFSDWWMDECAEIARGENSPGCMDRRDDAAQAPLV